MRFSIYKPVIDKYKRRGCALYFSNKIQLSKRENNFKHNIAEINIQDERCIKKHSSCGSIFTEQRTEITSMPGNISTVGSRPSDLITTKPLSYMQIKPTAHNSADTSGI